MQSSVREKEAKFFRELKAALEKGKTIPKFCLK
jgi:hypothetical protein